MSSLLTNSARPALLSILAESMNPSTAIPALHRLIDLAFQSPHAQPLSFIFRCTLAGMQSLQSAKVRQAIGGRQHDTRQFWKALQEGLPVHMHAGLSDQILDPLAVQRELALAKNLEVTLVEGGGHSLFWEDADDTARVLANFVRRVRRI